MLLSRSHILEHNKGIPPRFTIILIMIVQPAIQYGMETVSMTSSDVKKLDVTEMKMCRCVCGHTDHVSNDQVETGVENITQSCKNAILGGLDT